MLHQDASTHGWFGDRKRDLMITMDDATSRICSGFFVEQEGTWSSFLGVRETIAAKGIFASLYTDRGSHYWYTPKAGGKVDKEQPTQFGRAMKELGIEMIPSYSPQAQGRCERCFGTLQGRLPQELAREGIREMGAWPSSTTSSRWGVTIRTGGSRKPATGPGRPRRGGSRPSLPSLRSRRSGRDEKSGQTTCYQDRTCSFASNRHLLCPLTRGA